MRHQHICNTQSVDTQANHFLRIRIIGGEHAKLLQSRASEKPAHTVGQISFAPPNPIYQNGDHFQQELIQLQLAQNLAMQMQVSIWPSYQSLCLCSLYRQFKTIIFVPIKKGFLYVTINFIVSLAFANLYHMRVSERILSFRYS